MKKFIARCSLLVILLSTIYYLPSTLFAQETTPSATLSPSAPHREEQAVYNLNQGLLPAEAIKKESEDQNFFQRIIYELNQLFSRLFNQPKFFAQSESIHQANLPKELKPEEEASPGGQIKSFLGGSTGFYGVSLPKFEGTEETIKASEDLYQKAHFPEGINPITGQ